MDQAKSPAFQTFQVILGLGPGIPYREVRALAAHLRETCNVVRAEMLDSQDICLRRFYADVHANKPKAQDLEVSIRLRVVSSTTDPVVFGNAAGRFVGQLKTVLKGDTFVKQLDGCKWVQLQRWLNDDCPAV